jgi:predicted GIY-YIG superfamily endonuclease
MKQITWDFVQNNSDQVLTCGLLHLKNQPVCSSNCQKGIGNYLISLDGVPFYIGESNRLDQRIKEQFKDKKSTFYKNYCKWILANPLSQKATIDLFRFQFMLTSIGRKEIEEFGIVNLPTKVNNFQKGKRLKCSFPDEDGLWQSIQDQTNKLLTEAEPYALTASTTPWTAVMPEPIAGLYLLRDSEKKLIYVGESSNLAARIMKHKEQTYISALRRNIGRSVFDFELHVRNGMKRYFTTDQEERVTEFLDSCSLAILPVSVGRFELEEFIIKKHRPPLIRKGNKD